MPLYTDSPYYYSSLGGSGLGSSSSSSYTSQLYSPYYTPGMYGTSSSPTATSPYAPYSSIYNRSNYVVPQTPRSSNYSSRYKPKLTPISESPLSPRHHHHHSNLIALTRIQSPKFTSYTTPRPTKYIAPRPISINTADIDVSSSRYKHSDYHTPKNQLEERRPSVITTDTETIAEDEKVIDEEKEAASGDAESSIIEKPPPERRNRSTIKRDRAVVRLSTIRSKSRERGKLTKKPLDKSAPTSWRDNFGDELSLSQFKTPKKSPGEKLLERYSVKPEIDEIPIPHEELLLIPVVKDTIRRLSIPEAPSFQEICVDISSDKIENVDDLNAGELRRRASVIHEQEMAVINQFVSSRMSTKRRSEKVRHKITATVDITEKKSPPKFTASVDIDEHQHHTVVLPKKKKKVVKKGSKDLKEEIANVEVESKKINGEKKTTKSKPAPLDLSKDDFDSAPVAKPKPIVKLQKSESGEDFWGQISSRETIYMNKRKDQLRKNSLIEEEETPKDDEETSPFSPLKKAGRFSKFQEDNEKEADEQREIERKKEEARLKEDKRKEEEEERKRILEIKKAEEKRKADELKKAEAEEKKKAESEKKKLDELKKAEELRKAEEKKKLDDLKKAEELRKAEEKKKLDDLKKAEDVRQAEEKKKLDELRKAEERRKLDEAKKAEELKKAEEKRKLEEAKKAEELRKAEEKRKLEEAKKAEELRKAEEKRKLEEAKKAEDLKKADEKRIAEEKRKEENLKKEEERRLAGEKKQEDRKVAMEKKKEVEQKLADLKRRGSEIKKAEEERQERKEQLEKSKEIDADEPISPTKKVFRKTPKKSSATTDDPLKKTPEAKKKSGSPTKVLKKTAKDKPTTAGDSEEKSVEKKKISLLDKNSENLQQPQQNAEKINYNNSGSTQLVAETKINTGTGAKKSPEINTKTKQTNVIECMPKQQKSPPPTAMTVSAASSAHQILSTTKTKITQTFESGDALCQQQKLVSSSSTRSSALIKSGNIVAVSENNKSLTVTSATTRLVESSSTALTSALDSKSSADSVNTTTQSNAIKTDEAKKNLLKQPESSSASGCSAAVKQIGTNTTAIATSSTSTEAENNLSKFATVSNLSRCLLDVDADLEDYCPASEDSSSYEDDSFSEDEYYKSLSASMKKKVKKERRKQAKTEAQKFDPNKKVKIDTKKKLYVKEEAPAYPMVATPRPLWKRDPKFTFSEESESGSEATDSETSEYTTTTEESEEDDLNPSGAKSLEISSNIVRMSTCSNDSGFDSGGTAPTCPKKMLECDVNCHKKCEMLTANLCGVNQKLIVEALASVRRGVREKEPRDSPLIPLGLSAPYKIDTAYEDDETSYTYGQFQKTGRFTAPATTIPRFKKYSVEDFHFLTVLGKGSFGKVLLAELMGTDYYYAVKCLKKDVVLEDDDVECTLIERKVLALGTKHPYLCHLFCTFQTESHLFFVMEYLNGGDLMFHIQESGRFPESRARFYGAEIISGLKFLHNKGIIYRDLKLDNVLLDFDGHVRIADFGMCKLQIYLDKTADSFCGTPDYMAPEIIKAEKYNQNVDWWSFGVLLYEMLVGQSPFSGCDEDELFWSICNEIPWFPVYVTQEATSLLKGLLQKDPVKRIGCKRSEAGDVKDHTFFQTIDWELLEQRKLEPPFKPQVTHPLDTKFFDKAFTKERVRLTPIDSEILQSMDQEQFQGFSYTNPNATPLMD